MMRYTWKRILTGIVSLFLLATVTFFLVRLIPGSPFQRGGVSEQVVEAVEEEYGLNDPLIEQYLSYMGNLLKGDLGISYQDPGTSVEEIIGRAAPLTVSLGLSALIVSVIVGTGCGVFYAASAKKGSEKGNRIIRNAGGGHSRFCRCDSSVNGIQCKIKMVSFVGFIFFFTLYFTGYGIVALSDGCDHPNDRTCIG